MYNDKIFQRIIEQTGATRINSNDPRFQQCHKGYCPSHDDSSPSFTVGIDQGNNISIHCHAGCAHDSLLNALKLSESDLQSPEKKKIPPQN